jgi:hypothetical protein
MAYSCSNCQSYEGDEHSGTCHRRAPEHAPASFAVFPAVYADTWCMEWSPKMEAGQKLTFEMKHPEPGASA